MSGKLEEISGVAGKIFRNLLFVLVAILLIDALSGGWINRNLNLLAMSLTIAAVDVVALLSRVLSSREPDSRGNHR